MSPGECRNNCSHRASASRSSQHLQSENRIPGHSRECSLRTVSPLMDVDLINRKLLPTDSVDTVIAQQFAKRYEILRQENESLRKTVIQQEEEIEKLKAIVKSLQLDGYSSESRNEKSTSSNSNSIPTLRVTPQKRSSTSSSTQTPRSPRSGRRSARRLLFPDTSESETTPTNTQRANLLRGLTNLRITESPTPTRSLIEPREPQSEPAVRMRGSHRNSLESIQTRETSVRPISLGDSSQRRRIRPVAVSRTISSQEISSQEVTPTRVATNPGRGLITITPTHRPRENRFENPPNSAPSLEYYLRQNRPDFIRNSERRIEAVRRVANKRAELEATRKELARKMSDGEIISKQQKEILLCDPSKIRTFSQREMSAQSKKRFMETTEYKKRVEQIENTKEKIVNRVMAEIHSQRIRMKTDRRPRSMIIL